MKTKLFIIAPFLLLATARANACAVCMGADDTVMRDASNTTMLALLCLVGFIFIATGATAFFLWRKANSVQTTSNA